MCSKDCILFGTASLKPENITGKRIIELGSFNINGSLQDYVKSHNPEKYIGVDLYEGDGVDVICKAEDVIGIYGEKSFDIIITTELIEHVFDWKKVINNMKLMCKNGGIIVITTRSFGFPKHGWPSDHWRFERYDMKYIFSDFNEHGSVYIENDKTMPGVFVKVVKPAKDCDFRLLKLDDYKLYNMIYDLRI
jgi:SAM-dependent methyltransferase